MENFQYGMEEIRQYGIWKKHLSFHFITGLDFVLAFETGDWFCVIQIKATCCDVIHM